MEKNDHVVERKKITLNEIGKFVRSKLEKVDSRKKIARCGDGRYIQSEDLGSLARFGGDAGYFAVVLAALRSLNYSLSEKTVHKVLEVIVKTIGGPTEFQFHTDENHGPEPGSGCGFLKCVRANPTSYGLTHELVKFINSMLLELRTEGAYEEVLRGPHKETAVVILRGDLHMAPQDENIQVFVVNKDLDKERLEQLAEAITAEVGIDKEVLLRSFVQISDMQTELTRSLLANDKPVFMVSGSVNNPIITEIQ